MPIKFEALAQFPNHYFIETGTYNGEAVHMALDAGFKNIRSVELSPSHYQTCLEKFRGRSEIRLWLGESADCLPDMIADCDKPATFWLDAHYSQGDTVKGRNDPPLSEELMAISKHPIKTHTILIDDHLGPTVLPLLQTINPNYRFRTIDGFQYFNGAVLKDSILVASP